MLILVRVFRVHLQPSISSGSRRFSMRLTLSMSPVLRFCVGMRKGDAVGRICRD